MKNYVLGLLVAALALGTSAFTATRTNDKVKTNAKVWFYNPTVGHTATTDMQAYTEVTPGNSGPECGGEVILCRITADEDPGNPGFPLLSNGDPGNAANEEYLQEYKDQ